MTGFRIVLLMMERREREKLSINRKHDKIFFLFSVAKKIIPNHQHFQTLVDRLVVSFYLSANSKKSEGGRGNLI